MLKIEYYHPASNNVYSVGRELTAEELQAFIQSSDPETLGFHFERAFTAPALAPVVMPPDWEALRLATHEEPFRSHWLRLMGTTQVNAYSLLLTSFTQQWPTEFAQAFALVVGGLPEGMEFTPQQSAEINSLLAGLNFQISI